MIKKTIQTLEGLSEFQMWVDMAVEVKEIKSNFMLCGRIVYF